MGIKISALSILIAALLLSVSPVRAAALDIDVDDESASFDEIRHMRMMKMMNQIMDTNKDGMLSKDEFMKMQEMTASKKFMMMDINNDGILSHEEYFLNAEFH